MPDMSSVLALSPVLPVVTIEDPRHAVPLAQALLAGGVPVMELTLRTPAALESMRLIARHVPQIRLGAGTVLSRQLVDDAVRAGAQFLVSPGTTPSLLDHMMSTGLPVLPGVATVSEAMLAAERGLSELKLFPAVPAGGPACLKALAAPLPQLVFCPTGGIDTDTAPDYLALPNVACVGGSWLTPADAIRSKHWAMITHLTKAALKLRPSNHDKMPAREGAPVPSGHCGPPQTTDSEPRPGSLPAETSDSHEGVRTG